MLNDMTIPHGFARSGSGAAYALQLTYDVLGLPPDVVRRGAERLPSTPMYDMVRAHLLRLHADADVLSTDPGAGALGSGAVERVARAWGFSTPSHFSRRFKAAYGVTPRQWRASRSLEPREPPASLLVEGRKGDG
ncbi:helix-turn-helix transcriptional regulator [Streptomyces sp. NPDC012825]|uniref:helix-turn-helix transcriptional regulator n=1 Tax=Streptomyces sp. NPDC012825 TaxID=3364851 RepID=UPI0036BC63C2